MIRRSKLPRVNDQVQINKGVKVGRTDVGGRICTVYQVVDAGTAVTGLMLNDRYNNLILVNANDVEIVARAVAS